MVASSAIVAAGDSERQREGARLGGSTRIDTAIAVSQHRFPEGADVAYLAAQEVNPDALVGGGLQDGPLLLAPRCGVMPQAVLDELDRLEVARVTVVGGHGAVAEQILRQAVQGEAEPGLACPDAYPAERHGVTMEVWAEEDDPEVAARYRLTNNSEGRRYWGEPFILERFESGGFERVEGGWLFPLPLYEVEPGGSMEFSVPAWTQGEDGHREPLPPGRYRVIKEVWLDREGQHRFDLGREFVHR